MLHDILLKNGLNIVKSDKHEHNETKNIVKKLNIPTKWQWHNNNNNNYETQVNMERKKKRITKRV